MTSRNLLIRTLTIGFLALVALVEVFPYFWIATTSLKDLAGVLQFPPSLLPLPPTGRTTSRPGSPVRFRATC